MRPSPVLGFSKIHSNINVETVHLVGFREKRL